MTDDKRLIEDYLPIAAISAEATREKSARKGNISTLHLWWARRPLAGCRSIVYGTLVPTSRFIPNGASIEKRKSLGRANAAKFIERLCACEGERTLIAEAQQHILESHAERLTRETGKPVTVGDIEAGRAPRPKVLDMFAGGGAIPLEALRLGCEAYALDLNPVAHIIQLCTLVYPQRYGKPDPAARGMVGPKNAKKEATWGGLVKEVRHWGEWVLKKLKAEIRDLYPLIPDPDYKPKRVPAKDIFGNEEEVPPGYLVPVAYLWTRTVVCKKPTCQATVPLVRQTWLSKKAGRFIALRMHAPKGEKQVRFEVVESDTEEGLGFDPAGFSKAGNATCPFCGTVADDEYVKRTTAASGHSEQLMAVVVSTRRGQGKRYFAAHEVKGEPAKEAIEKRLATLTESQGLRVPDTQMESWSGVINPPLNGLTTYRSLYNARQLYALMACIRWLRAAFDEMQKEGIERDRAMGILLLASTFIDQLADWNCSLAHWIPQGEKIGDALAGPGIGMSWDFTEVNPLIDGSGTLPPKLNRVCDALETIEAVGQPARVTRGDATAEHWPAGTFDAVITDPPYYSNLPYSHLADCIYVWLRVLLGDLLPEHFATDTTPKKKEAIASVIRDKGDARNVYEGMMTQAFSRASTLLKPDGSFICVYAHKTTAGWATLVDSIRNAGFEVIEAWPVEMEKRGRVIAIDAAALKSNIFIVGRKRDPAAKIGQYDAVVQPELEAIVRERVETLWDQGISGADLVIACVGAGLRAFTRFARVEYANGDEVPAERFLTEVETVVLDSILARLSKEVGGKGTSLAGVDPATRFYTLWRYTYRAGDLEGGEAIIFANGTHVELDGVDGLANGARALVEKKKGKYRLRDFTERGDDEELGHPTDEGHAAPLVDVLHRVLWLMEQRPRELAAFLREAEPNREQLRLVAQALAGPALKGSELADVTPTAEVAALAKLTSNWRSVIEDNLFSPEEQAARKRGQQSMFE